MQIKILAFGVFTDIFKANKIEITVLSPCTVADLKALVIRQYPQTADLNFAVAVDEAYADDNLQITENQTIALIPPVSGG
ncbi:MAG: MoaD/ThiS family protein [Flavobacteriaceae bacterium]|nr:MoaD/ThiS family protein [Flavobacteriaceae bacterium]